MTDKDPQSRPVVLMVGRGEPMELALRVALDRRGLQVKSASAGEAVDSAAQVAPDLMLLVGDASEHGGEGVLRYLAENPATAVVPVALLSEDASLDGRMRAFKSGAVAVVPRDHSADGMAEKVATVLRELPERPGAAAGELGEATLDDLVEWVKKELRTGILTVEPADGEDPESSMRLVLGAGQPVAEALSAFVERLRPLIARAEPLRYEFQEEAGSRLGLLDDLADDEPPGDPALLDGLRILLMDGDPGRADSLATALRERGALVGVTDATEGGLDRVESLDPEVVILDAEAIEGAGFEAVRRLRRDVRMRWSSLLVVQWDELWPDARMAPPTGKLATHLAPLIENDRRLTDRAKKELRFDTRLELTGPGRLLRALVRAGPTLHILVRSPKATVAVDLSEGLVVGAQGTLQGDDHRAVEGASALAALLALGTGRVHVERKGHPSVMNIMAPADEALEAAAREESPVPISFRPPAAPVRTVPEEAARAGNGDGRPGAAKAGNGASKKRTMLGTGLTPPAPPEERDDDKSTWEDEPTQPPTDLQVLEAARKMATRSKPPPGSPALMEASAGGGSVSGGGGGGSPRPAAAAATAGGGNGHGSGAPKPPGATAPSPGKPRKKTLVGMAPPGPSKAKPGAAPAPPKVGAPPPPSQAARKAIPTPKPNEPLELANQPTGPRRDESTEELELADMLEPEEEAAPGGTPDIAFDKTMLPTEGMAPPPPPPGRHSPAPPPPPVAAKAGKAKGKPRAPEPAQPPGADTEATEVLPRDFKKTGGAKRLGLLAGAAALAAAILAGALWLGGGSEEEPVAEVARPETGETGETGKPAAEASKKEEAAAKGEGEKGAAGAGTGTETGTGAETGAETETETGAEEAEAEIGAETGTEAETGAEAETEEAPTGHLAEVLAPRSSNPSLESDRLVAEAERMIDRGELDDAETVLDHAMELDPKNARGFAGYASLALARKDATAALDWAEKAVHWRRRRAPYYVILGDALRMNGKEDEARHAYMKALSLDPNLHEARKRLR